MIISHKYRFIFIKTEKTAGTSVEIGLTKFLGAEDVITPISPEDEKLRADLGYRGPQNHFVPFGKYTGGDWARMLRHRKRLAFYNHVPAQFIRQYLGEERWKSYYKFTFERNPWDKAVSLYFWEHQAPPRPTISEFIESGGLHRIRGFELYAINGQIAVDRVCKYERLDDELGEIASQLGLPEKPSLVRAKSTQRTDKRSYRDVLNGQDRDQIAKVFAREIAYFGYEW